MYHTFFVAKVLNSSDNNRNLTIQFRNKGYTALNAKIVMLIIILLCWINLAFFKLQVSCKGEHLLGLQMEVENYKTTMWQFFQLAIVSKISSRSVAITCSVLSAYPKYVKY